MCRFVKWALGQWAYFKTLKLAVKSQETGGALAPQEQPADTRSTRRTSGDRSSIEAVLEKQYDWVQYAAQSGYPHEVICGIRNAADSAQSIVRSLWTDDEGFQENLERIHSTLPKEYRGTDSEGYGTSTMAEIIREIGALMRGVNPAKMPMVDAPKPSSIVLDGVEGCREKIIEYARDGLSCFAGTMSEVPRGEYCYYSGMKEGYESILRVLDELPALEDETFDGYFHRLESELHVLRSGLVSQGTEYRQKAVDDVLCWMHVMQPLR